MSGRTTGTSPLEPDLITAENFFEFAASVNLPVLGVVPNVEDDELFRLASLSSGGSLRDWEEVMHVCDKCGKHYGKSNLIYQNCQVWIACDCMEEHKAFFIMTDKLEFRLNEPGQQLIPVKELQ